MKKILIALLMILTTTVGMSQTIGEAFYVYRNDGMINTFFRNEIDSIAYSYYDADSLLYEEIVSQVVYTTDSIYQIPLAVIDSVGFVTPETKYQPNVTRLEGEIRDYILGSDSLTVYFRSDTPDIILPEIGDKLVTTEMSEVFGGGFLGQVDTKRQKGDTIAVNCCAIGLEEVFECFYYSTNVTYQNNTNKARAARWDWGGYYVPDPFVFSFTGFLNANIKPIDCPTKFLKLPPKLDVTIAPTFQSKGSIIIHPLRGVIITVDIKQHTSLSQDFAVSGSFGMSHDFAPNIIPMYPILPFVSIYGEMGFFLKANGSLSLESQWNQSLDYDIHYQTSYIPPMTIPTTVPKFTISNVNLKTDHNEEFMLDGSVAGGIYGEVGIVPLYSKYIAKAGFRFEAGIKLGGDVMLYNSDGDNSLFSTSTYEKVKAGELNVKTFCNVGLQAKLLDVGKGNINLFKKEWDIAKFKLVPDFSSTTLTRDDESSSTLWAATTASGSTIVPSTLGFKLFEGEKKEGIKGSNSINYWNPFGYAYPYTDVFKSQSPMKSYMLYPTVNLFGIELLAEPCAKIERYTTPITLEAEDITDTTAKVKGKIEGYELLDDTVRFGLGYYEASSSGSTMYDASSINEDGIFSVEFKALKPNTQYKYFAYLVIEGDTFYGETKEFATTGGDAAAYYVIDGNSMTYYYDEFCKERHGTKIEKEHFVSSYESTFQTTMPTLLWVIFDSSFANYYPTKFSFNGCGELNEVENLNYLKTDSICDMASMFEGCGRLKNLDLSGFNTSNVTNMNGMFLGCHLTSLDLSSFDTSNVTNMGEMFLNCGSLTSLDLSSFNTSKVTNMGEMFVDCTSLNSLNLSSFNTSNVTEMGGMFWGCSSLTSLDLSNFNTSNVTNMKNMFNKCSSLTSLHLSIINTSTFIEGMFWGCSSLEYLDLSYSGVTFKGRVFLECSTLKYLDLSNSDLSSISDFSGGFFRDCKSLISLKLENAIFSGDCSRLFDGLITLKEIDLRNVNTSNVTEMDEMFANCTSLTSLDLSSFDMSNVNDVDRMFYGCSTLRTIYAGNWNIWGVSTFEGCTNLVGGMGTKIGENVYGYDEYGRALSYYCSDDGHAAHIDGGVDNPGLFTAK